MTDLTLPNVPTYVVHNITRLDDTGPTLTHLGIDRGRLVDPATLPTAPVIDATGWTALPRLSDAHVHIDKAYSLDQTGMGDGTLGGAMDVFLPAARGWGPDQFRPRMTRALRAAFTAGTGALRSHIDCPTLPHDTPAWQVAMQLRDAWAPYLTLQLSALSAVFRATEPAFDRRCAQLAQDRGVLGLFIPAGPVDRPALRRALETAATHGLAVDLHIDEHLQTGPLALQALAEEVLTTGFDGRVLAGHGCALAVADAPTRLRTMDAIAKAGIAIATLPRTNLYLQDRAAGRTPTQRGVTLIHELDARGIPVSLASDNVEDAFFPFGDFDLLGLLAETAMTAHLDQALAYWLRAVTRHPAQAMGLPDHSTLIPGDPADFVLIPSARWPGLLVTPPARRIVVQNGQPVSLPDADPTEIQELANV